jgi:hypothetical protein
MGIYKSKLMVGGAEKTIIAICHNEEDAAAAAAVVTETVVNRLHHILVLDRSGSLYRDLDQLMDNVVMIVNEIGEEDIITLIWFSGAGQHRTVIKGASKHEKLTKIIDTLRSTVGCTCFSDPLKEINLILDEIGDIAPVSVTMFTDGNPVVPWSIEKETTMCFEELDKMAPRILAFNTVGYGNYYNQELLRAFSATSEFGSMVHSTRIEEFLTIFNHNFEKISDAVSESIDISAPVVIYLNRTFTKMDSGDFHLSRIDKRKNQFFLIGDGEFTFEYQGKTYNTTDIKVNLQPGTKTNFYYALVYNLYYAGRRKEALDVLATNLHDKALIDSHMASFTFNEVANHSTKLEDSLFHNEFRMLDGIADDDYVPADDAPCIMDALLQLQLGGSLYVPFSNNIAEYTRATRKAVDEFDLFKKDDEEVRVPFGAFTFNKKHMNLSLLVTINGVVQINPKAAKKVALPSIMKSHIFRNYMLIKDGNINIPMIEVLLTNEDFMNEKIHAAVAKFLGHEEIDGVTYSRSLIDLTSLPIINRLYVNESTTIEHIFNDTVKTTKLEARTKVIGYLLDMFEGPAATTKIAAYTPEQIEVLMEHGIGKDLSYNGVGVTKASAEESDSYQSRTMEFVLDGFSSWAKITDMLERVALMKAGNAKAKLTTNMVFLKEAYDEVMSEVGEEMLSDDPTVPQTALTLLAKNTKAALIQIRNEINVLKIAKLLTGDWFDDLQTDDKGKFFYEKDGVKMIAKAAYTTEYF